MATGWACGAAFRSEGFNLIDRLDDCPIPGQTGNGPVAETVLLAALGLDSANTDLHILRVDSRVIDGGSGRLTVHLREMGRPTGDGCHIGAVGFRSTDTVIGPVNRVNLPMVSR